MHMLALREDDEVTVVKGNVHSSFRLWVEQEAETLRHIVSENAYAAILASPGKVVDTKTGTVIK